MKWLQDNPVGMALVAIGGVLLLCVLGMAIIWNLPVSVKIAETEEQQSGGSKTIVAARQIADVEEFQVINEKPVFNESRQPVADDVDDGGQGEDLTVAVKDAPDVKLTGVIITPGMKIASLTPSNAELESVMAHEGESLTGEFVGWQVSSVNPRNVVLESRDGQTLALDLQVHDIAIKEPPKPATPARADTAQDENVASDSDEPLSRAEQIRQRIAERREELRREQEEKQSQNNSGAGGTAKSDTPPTYQQAIQALMNNNSKDPDSDEGKDG